MPLAITCEITAGALPKLKEIRAMHLQYIRDHQDEILFGGPARDASGVPQTMIIVLKDDDRSRAEEFVKHEPYSASGAVFSSVLIRPWSQVMPQPQPGALNKAIQEELSHTK
jgi:uncharacterized protein YciI